MHTYSYLELHTLLLTNMYLLTHIHTHTPTHTHSHKHTHPSTHRLLSSPQHLQNYCRSSCLLAGLSIISGSRQTVQHIPAQPTMPNLHRTTFIKTQPPKKEKRRQSNLAPLSHNLVYSSKNWFQEWPFNGIKNNTIWRVHGGLPDFNYSLQYHFKKGWAVVGPFLFIYFLNGFALAICVAIDVVVRQVL